MLDALSWQLSADHASRRAPYFCLQTYMIVVQLKFKTEAAREKFEEGYRRIAVHTKENEPETLFYELSVSEDDPKRLISVERCALRRRARLTGSMGHQSDMACESQSTMTKPSFAGMRVGTAPRRPSPTFIARPSPSRTCSTR